MIAFKNNRGKIAGKLEGGVFYKTVKRSKHFMRMYNGWGIDDSIVVQLEKEGCEQVEIYDSEDRVYYSVPFAIFKSNGIKGNFDTPQTFLPVHFWSRSNQKKLF